MLRIVSIVTVILCFDWFSIANDFTVLMMLILGALERTSKQYEALLTADPTLGLEVVGITYVGYSEEAVIEVRRKE